MMMNPMVLVWQRSIDMAWNNMVYWLRGTFRDLHEEATNAAVQAQLKAQGAIIHQGQVHVKASAPSNRNT
jgi:hypothetical protein